MALFDDHTAPPAGTASNNATNAATACLSGPRLTLGARHNNFWNIKQPYGGDDWLGVVGYDRQGHAIFEDPAYGVRAAIRVLRSYQLEHNINTVTGIIGRWAPREDGNPVQEYARKVARDAGVRPDQRLRLFDPDGSIADEMLLRKVMFSMAEFECGHGFSLVDDEFRRGMALYKS